MVTNMHDVLNVFSTIVKDRYEDELLYYCENVTKTREAILLRNDVVEFAAITALSFPHNIAYIVLLCTLHLHWHGDHHI